MTRLTLTDPGLGSRCARLALLLALVLSAAAPSRLSAQIELPAESFDVSPPAVSGAQKKKTFASWRIRVQGRPFQDFDNQGAEHVLLDWFTGDLLEIGAFQVVNRQELRQIIDHYGLDVISDDQEVSVTGLSEAGRVARADYIVLGSFTSFSLSQETKIDVKLLDVKTSAYARNLQFELTIPLNPALEHVKPVIGQIVADLASRFPIMSRIAAIDGPQRLTLSAGSNAGISRFAHVELFDGVHRLSTGYVTRVLENAAEVELEDPISSRGPGSLEAQVRAVPNAEASLAVARLRLRQGRLEEARQLLETHRAFLEHAELLTEHARICRDLGESDAAIVSYREALELDPNNSPLLEEATTVLLETGRSLEVIELLKARERTAALSLNLGRAYEAHGYRQRAHDAYKEAVRRSPSSYVPHLQLASLAQVVGKPDEAARELAAARRLAPGKLEVDLVSKAMSLVTAPAVDGDGEDGFAALIEDARAAGLLRELVAAAEFLASNPSLEDKVRRIAQVILDAEPRSFRGRLLTAKAEALRGNLEPALSGLDQLLHENADNLLLLVESGRVLG